MIGSFITRGLVLILGYAYPAYECYKTVEMNRADIELLRFWCQYWILVAVLTVCERISDVFVGWVPMYGEAKLAFFIYLWFPKTKGTTYVYDSFFKPYVAKHETDIDRNLLELRTRAGDMANLYWQKAISYGQTRILDILQYIASQSKPPRPAQTQPGKTTGDTATAIPKHTSAAATKPHDRESSSSKDQENATEEAGPSEDSKAAAPAPAAVLNEQKTTQTVALIKKTSSDSSTEVKVMQVELASGSSENTEPPPQDTVMVEAKRVTRARSRRTVRSIGK